jgi:hypothetical protein
MTLDEKLSDESEEASIENPELNSEYEAYVTVKGYCYTWNFPSEYERLEGVTVSFWPDGGWPYGEPDFVTTTNEKGYYEFPTLTVTWNWWYAWTTGDMFFEAEKEGYRISGDHGGCGLERYEHCIYWQNFSLRKSKMKNQMPLLRLPVLSHLLPMGTLRLFPLLQRTIDLY